VDHRQVVKGRLQAQSLPLPPHPVLPDHVSRGRDK